MCFAALVSADLRRLEREFTGSINIAEFERTYWARVTHPKAFKLPVALDRHFLATQPPESSIVAAITQYRKDRVPEWEAELFEQRKRHADAQRKLAKKMTKGAQKDLQVSADKVEQRLKWLSDFRDTQTTDDDTAVYPKHYAPLIVQTDTGRQITPMRYHCRLPGHAPEVDQRLEGNYNAFGALVSVS
jgi:hypothetical protein